MLSPSKMLNDEPQNSPSKVTKPVHQQKEERERERKREREREIHEVRPTITHRNTYCNPILVEEQIQSVKKFRKQTLRVCRGDKTKPFCYVTNL